MNNIDDLFIDFTNLSKIAIPPNITSIGKSSFCNCSLLKEISIPYSVTSIGNNSFKSCRILTEISIPPSVTTIGDFAFFRCESLTKIYITSVISIGSYSFAECSSLSSVTIPSSIKSIGEGAFSKCMMLNYFLLPNSIESIGSKAFEYCTNLTEISIPPSITSIKENSFYKCISLRKVIMPSSVTSIGEYSFYGCESLSEISIPPSVTSINKYTFYNCKSLIEISIPPSVTSIKEFAFGNCISLSQITIPSSVKSISNSAFYFCSKKKDLETMELNDNYNSNFPLPRFPLFFFCTLPVLICILTEFIISIVWWTRIHPWFAHGYGSGKRVYQCLEACWISSLLLMFFMIFGLIISGIQEICNIIVKVKTRKIYHKIIFYYTLFAIIAFICLSCISTICGIIASSYTFVSKKIDEKSIRCLNYIFQGSEGAINWAAKQSIEKQKEFENWYSKMLKKAYNTNGVVTQYFCLKVGIPTFIFAVIPQVLSFLYYKYYESICCRLV